MSVKVMGAVWGLDLPANEMLVLLAMADHSDHEGNNIYPSIGLIAWKTGYSESQVRRIIKRLVKSQVLTRQERRGESNLYGIDLSKGAQKEPYNSAKRNPLQNDTPSIAMTPQGLHSYDTPTPAIAMTPEPSLEPSKKQSSTPNGATVQKPVRENATRRAPDEWDLAIGTALKTTATGFVTQVKGMMFGRGKKGTEWAACNFDPPVTEVQEIIEFGVYVEQRMRREKITIKLSKPLTIQRWFYDFRAAKKPAESKILTLDVSAADYPDAADFLPLDEFGNYRLEGA